MIEPLRLSLDLACPPEHAFWIWTERIDNWWPADHTATGDPEAVVVLEPRVGGRIYERAPSGQEHDWGEITAWDPPARLGYLWHLRRNREDATDVVIRFLPEGTGTRLEIEHTGWERLGDDGHEWRSRNFGGWTSLLPHFTAAAHRPTDTGEESG